jgi:hypothetical protein
VNGGCFGGFSEEEMQREPSQWFALATRKGDRRFAGGELAKPGFENLSRS